jgi:hypothetical protein
MGTHRRETEAMTSTLRYDDDPQMVREEPREINVAHLLRV